MSKLIECKTCHASISSSAKRCPACGEPVSPARWVQLIYVLIVFAVLAGISVIYQASDPKPTREEMRRESALKQELAYLDDVEEIVSWRVDDNNVYIHFAPVPDDWRGIIRGAALRGNRAIDFGCHVWAIDHRVRQARGGNAGYLDEVTARYGKVRD